MAGGKKGGGKAGSSSKGGKGGGKGDLKNCNHVKARHILCEKYGKINECLEAIREEYPGKIQGSKFGEFAKKYSECSSGNSGGNLGWFPRGKMEKVFEEKAFNSEMNQIIGPFKGSNGYHLLYVEGRKA